MFEKVDFEQKEKNDKKEEKSNRMNENAQNGSVRTCNKFCGQKRVIIVGIPIIDKYTGYTKLWGIRLEAEGSRYLKPNGDAAARHLIVLV